MTLTTGPQTHGRQPVAPLILGAPGGPQSDAPLGYDNNFVLKKGNRFSNWFRKVFRGGMRPVATVTDKVSGTRSESKFRVWVSRFRKKGSRAWEERVKGLGLGVAQFWHDIVSHSSAHLAFFYNLYDALHGSRLQSDATLLKPQSTAPFVSDLDVQRARSPVLKPKSKPNITRVCSDRDVQRARSPILHRKLPRRNHR